MQYSVQPHPKPSPNISEIVSKFARVWRFRSIGVFFTETPNAHQPNNALLSEDSSDATEEGECDKVHPHAGEIQPGNRGSAEEEVLMLFDAISTLKSAYVQLQEAHIPYDPIRIRAADELVVTQLEKLYKIKRSHKGKQLKEVSCLSAEIQVREKQFEKLKFQLNLKNTQILNLREELRDLELKNMELEEHFREKTEASIRPSFEEVFEAASKAIHDFAKPLISLMKASGWDLDRAADSVEASVVYSKRSHKKYSFEAYVVRRILLLCADPIDSLIKEPHSGFAKFCRTKYLSIVHSRLEASFFGNLDQRTIVSIGRHPRTPFYAAFVKMARWVWVLLGFAATSEPKAEIYGVKRGSEFSDVYMDNMEQITQDMVASGEGILKYKVEFMVMPGFRIGDRVIKSRVYLSPMRIL
ncbi:hypothetical protein NMG60_11034327 [Bertholletia excelsa]